MGKMILGRALLQCKLCGQTKELIIESSKEEYKHDYSTLNNLGHKCPNIGTKTVNLGKFELKGIKFDTDVVDIDAGDGAVVAFNQPPLKIDWSENDEN